MAGIELQRITKRYPDGTEGVKTLDLDIGDGEFMILVGPSGCGKSTALRMVAGLEDITEGELLIGGKRVNDVAPKDRDIAMVFQNYALYPHMTVRENMGYALKKRKLPRDQIDQQGRGGREGPRPHRAPRPQAGQHVRRPAPARGHGPRDRPRAAGLPDGRAAVEPRREAARADARRGRAAAEAARHDDALRHPRPDRGDDARRPRRGHARRHLQQVGPPKELYNDPVNLFVAGFIGSPAMNFVTARLEENAAPAVRRRAAGGRLRARLDGGGAQRDVIAGVRPEHFEDARFAQDIERPLEFQIDVDVVEEMGSELYAFFSIKSDAVRSRPPGARAGRRRRGPRQHSGETTAVARLNAESDARSGARPSWCSTRTRSPCSRPTART